MAREPRQEVARGATHADAYFQHARTNSVRMEDGIISQAASHIEQGVGLRVVVGDQVGFAFTEDLTEQAMLAAARTASAIASGGGAAAPEHFTYRDANAGFYQIAVPWQDVGIEQKLPRIQKVEALTRRSTRPSRRSPSTGSTATSGSSSSPRTGASYRLSGRWRIMFVAGDVRAKRRSCSRTTRTSRDVAASTGSATSNSRRSRRKRSIAPPSSSTPSGRRPASCRSSSPRARAACCFTRRSATGSRRTSIARTRRSTRRMLGQKIAGDFVTIVDDATVGLRTRRAERRRRG